MTPESLQQLHQSLNLSLRQGILNLHNVQFNTIKLQEILIEHLGLGQHLGNVNGNGNGNGNGNVNGNVNGNGGLSLKSVQVKRMQIRLQLIYDNGDNGDNGDNDIIGNKINSNQNDSANARLVAHITLDGLDIVIGDNYNNMNYNNTNASNNNTSNTNSTNNNNTNASNNNSTTTTTPSRLTFPLRSYMQAAIDSLKLSLAIHDLSIRIHSHSHPVGHPLDNDTGNDNTGTATSFIHINIDSLSFNECRQDDSEWCNNHGYTSHGHTSHGSKNVYQKKLELDTVTILVGRQEHGGHPSQSHSQSQPWMEQQEIFRMDGIITIRHGNTNAQKKNGNGNRNGNGNVQPPQKRRNHGNQQLLEQQLQQDQQEQFLDIMIQPEIQMGVSVCSLERILDVVHSYSGSVSSMEGCGGGADSGGTTTTTTTTTGSSTGCRNVATATTGNKNGGDANIQEEEDEIGLLAKIIQRQGDEECQYMDNLSKKKRNARDNRGMEKDEIDNDIDVDIGRQQTLNRDEVQEFLYSDEEEDEDLLHYRNALEASINSNINLNSSGEMEGREAMGTGTGTGTGVNAALMRVRFYMKCVTMQLYLTDTSMSTISRMDDGMETESNGYAHDQDHDHDHADSKESVSFTIEELDVSLTSSSMHQLVSLHVGDFYIDHLVSCGDDESQESMPMLQCYKECFHGKCGRDDEQDEDCGNFAISLTIDIEQNVGAASASAPASRTNCNLTIHPLQMLYIDSVMNKVAMGFTRIAAKGQCKGRRGHGKIDMDSEPPPKPADFNCTVICGGILAIAPLYYTDDRQPLEETLQNIFQRSGYHIAPLANQLGPAITCEVSCLSILADGASFLDECEKDQEEMQVKASVQSCVISFVCPLRVPESHNENSCDKSFCKFDIVALESEDKIDPDAVVKIRYARTALSGKTEAYKKQRAKVQFPAVTPLASVKASQQCDYTEQKGQSDNHSNFDTRKAGLRKGSDPQVAMLKAASECEKRIEIHIPSLLFDLSAPEKDGLAAILTSSSLSRKEFSNAHSKDQDSAEELAASSSVNIVVYCDQCSFSIHQANQTNPMIEETTFCYILICDGFKSHFLVGNAGLEHMRVLFHDITLYEGKALVAELICISLPLRLLNIFFVKEHALA